MPRFTRIAAVSALALALMAGTSFASPLFGVQAFGGFNTHSMKEVNKGIDDLNTSSGSNFDNIKSGMSFGGGANVTVNDMWQIGAHYEKLMPKKSSDTGIEIKLGANAIGGSIAYLFPSTTDMRFGVGVSVDYMKLTSEVTDPTSPTQKVHGTGVGFLPAGMMSYGLSPMFSFDALVGYRIAKIDIKDVDGVKTDPTDPVQSEDYSGVALRIGISIHQPKE